MIVATGKSILKGIAIGKIKFLKKAQSEIVATASDPAVELERFEDAKAKAVEQLQALYDKVKLRIDQPTDRRAAERVGIARSKLVSPVSCLETSAEHVKRTVAYRVDDFRRNIVAEHDNLRISAAEIIPVESRASR